MRAGAFPAGRLAFSVLRNAFLNHASSSWRMAKKKIYFDSPSIQEAYERAAAAYKKGGVTLKKLGPR